MKLYIIYAIGPEGFNGIPKRRMIHSFIKKESAIYVLEALKKVSDGYNKYELNIKDM